MEHEWRPRDAAERAHERDRVAWHHTTHPGQLPTQHSEKDHIFTSEEAVNYDRKVVEKQDPARGTWVPHQPKVPDYDLDLRSEEPKPENFG